MRPRSTIPALTFGASSGGFTDCLLKRGAQTVFAVDSGHGQLDESLAADPRVVSLEGFNARGLRREHLGSVCDVAVCDVSFISQTLLSDAICDVLAEDGLFVTLIKPQFECGKEALGKGGIVKSPADRLRAVRKVIDHFTSCGLTLFAFIVSPVKGKDGNTEYLASFRRGRDCALTEQFVKEAVLC